jgi:hypothetical protein
LQGLAVSSPASSSNQKRDTQNYPVLTALVA